MANSILHVLANIANSGGGGGIPTDGLIAEWLFSNNLLDTSGNGNDLTNSGATFTADRNGVPNEAIQLGTSKYAYSTTFEQNITDFSVACWFKADALINLTPIIIRTNLSSYTTGWGIILYNGKIRFFTNNWNSSPNEISFTDTTGYHFIYACFVEGDGLYMSIDNGAINYVNIGTPLSQSETLNIGGGFGTTYFQGKEDVIRMYNRQLTTEEITALYNE